MITSTNSKNSLDYRGLFEKAAGDLKEYAKRLRDKINEANNKETLLLFINRFPEGKDYVKRENSYVYEPDKFYILDFESNNYIISTDDYDSNQIYYEAINDDYKPVVFNNKIIEDITIEEIEKIVIISTLNDYFCNIVELTQINTQYVVLPLDEEIFEINANSRSITVPASFKKNGIGVQGDHTAETIHFVIDRYFDSIDLAADDIFIAIEYEGPKGETKIDPAVFKDITTLQNKIIFGWVIDKEVTKFPGNVKFAVHFFKGNVDKETKKITEVSYSFNTLIAQVAINKAFEFDLSSFDTERDPSQLIIDRLTNSKADGATKALMPIFVINLPEGRVDLKDADGIDADEESYTFNALAHSPDAGYITYTWYREEGETDEKLVSHEDYIKTADKTPVENKIYYYQDNEDNWIRLNSNDTFEEGRNYFEYRSFCVADKVGTYYVAIDNHVGTDTERAESNRVVIPGPSIPAADTIDIVIYDPKNRYGWDEEAGYVRATLEPDTMETLSITAEANPGDSLKYQWYIVPGANERLKTIPDVELPEYGLGAIDGAIEGNYTTEVTGWYTVALVSERNKDTEIFPTEKYYRVTSIPSIPLFIERENAEDTGNILEEEVYLPLGETAKVELQDMENTDKIVFKWYKDVKPYPYNENAKENEEYDELIFTDIADITDNMEKPLKSEISTAELYNYVGDVIYCKPTNIYNKAEITGPASRRFFILDSKASGSVDEE